MPDSPYKHGIVTTPRKREDLEYLARETAERTGVPFVERADKSLEKLRAEFFTPIVCVESPEGPFLGTASGKLFFHEGTSVIRTGDRVTGNKLPSIVAALDLSPGDKVLDCTLGLGIDSLVAAVHLGDGDVTGLEAGVLLADIVARGMKNYSFTRSRIAEAARRITVLNEDYRTFLKNCEDRSYDSIYFDPMFDHTVEKSDKIKRLREVAVMDALEPEHIKEACRVARKRVVVKARRGCFGSIEFSEIMPSGKSLIYGIIRP